jgi:hypothetical protein
MRIASMKKTAAFAALAFLAAQSAFGEAIEVRAGSIVLPSKPPSSIAVTPCQGCKPMLVHTSVQAQYFVNRQPVSLDELRIRLTGRPDAFVTLLYDKKTGQLRQLRASIYQ